MRQASEGAHFLLCKEVGTSQASKESKGARGTYNLLGPKGRKIQNIKRERERARDTYQLSSRRIIRKCKKSEQGTHFLLSKGNIRILKESEQARGTYQLLGVKGWTS